MQSKMPNQNESVQSETSTKPETGLKHGQFYVHHRTLDGKDVKVIVIDNPAVALPTSAST